MVVALSLSSHVNAIVVESTPTPTATPSAGGLSVRLEKPKTPTNQNTFDLVYVTLDVLKRDVTVTCYKKGPTDSDYVAFGTPAVFPNGGNTGVCSITSSILSAKGDYSFQVIATAGINQATDVEPLSFNTEGPGDPREYSKTRANFCDYKISFKTADDGKTAKIEVYRSENTSFTADNGTKVSTIGIGPNTSGYSITTPPDCNKEYYFVIRAFDTAGNGSNLVGDSVVKVTTTTSSTSTTTSTTTGVTNAPEVQEGAVTVVNLPGSVLGEENTSLISGAEVLGESTPSSAIEEKQDNSAGPSYGIIVGGIVLLTTGAILLYVAKKNQSKTI